MAYHQETYFLRIFCGVLLTLQSILWLGKFSWTGFWFIQNFLAAAAFWTAFVPLFPFVLMKVSVFNPSWYPTFIGWVILMILQAAFSWFIAGMTSPIFERIATRRMRQKK